ncbi:asparaginase [Allohahella marinimesophila]|uniref:Asparaginase n=1 Tax=Allohahella marinimesophila TaxID=1054972 RepID=A0ABP7P6Z3_9GAMM
MNSERLPLGLLYTGGTIGMEPGERGLAITADAADFEARLRARLPSDCPAFERLDASIPLMDSSNAQPDDWRLLAQLIYQNRQHFAGFVVLTGTDTMAHTASALSFLLAGLELPVVLTGAQRPLGPARPKKPIEPTDAVSNVSSALQYCFALGDLNRPNIFLSCVFLAFDSLLLRGNCARKVDSARLRAFQSPNLPPVGQLIDGQVKLEQTLLYRDNPEFVRSLPSASLESRMAALDSAATWNQPAVASCFLLPGAAALQLDAALWPDCRALLLLSYGSGNIPSTDTAFLSHLSRLRQRGLLMLNTTQCLAGGVGGNYETGHALRELGIVSAGLMTPESAFVKLHLFARLPMLYPADSLDTDLCGEQIMPV